MIRFRKGQKQRLVRRTKSALSKRGQGDADRDSAVFCRGDTVLAENQAKPAQCLLESVRRKLEAGVLSQEGQDPASDQPDQLQRRVMQFLKLAHAGLRRSSVGNHAGAVRASPALFFINRTLAE